MTRSEFNDIAKYYLYLDGATGSNLVRAGMPSGVCPERWILEHPDVMLELQKQYVAAGTNILYAPTFTANRIKLAEYGLEEQMDSVIRKLVAISKAAVSEASQPVYIAGDLTMTGELLKPLGNMKLEKLITIYKEQITALEQAGVDLLVIETMMSLAETRAALIAAKEVSELPVMVTLTFEADGRTLYGTDAKTAAVVLESLGASAIGVNCSTGPAHMRQIVADMVSSTKGVPIIAKPNAGLPCLDEAGNTFYNMNADEFADEMKLLVEAGASLLGGCCGTTPEYIRRLRDIFGTGPVPGLKRKADGIRMLSSERQTVEFGLDDGFFIVGERINPTGKKILQSQLREGNFDKVLQFAEEQEKSGARILDVNMGMSGIDEKGVMLQALDEISMVTNLPLSLDSSHVDVLEAALRHYPGRALVNSVSMEKEKMDMLLPLVKKYGAMFILLPLSDKGLPENIQEKKQIIETVLERAYSLGLQDEDIVVDGLVSTVGANKKAALETLETIRYCREKGLASICGLSNISFGMPERSYVNTAFLTLAIREGLTMAIANPSQELLVSCALATDMLLNREEADIRYIEYAGTIAEDRIRKEAAPQRPPKETALQKPSEKMAVEGAEDRKGVTQEAESRQLSDKACECLSVKPENGLRITIRNSVLKGNRKGIAAQVREALAEGEEPSALLQEVLLPAINEVGELFDKGKYFLPQLIASAEAMKNAIEILEPLLLRETDSGDRPVVIIATVEGDIHDIGKNLVALMLKNYGFQVIDLGKDVPKEDIIRAAKENHAQIIALSALMTTTMRRMREVIAYAREEGLTAKVMIGGAVITQDYADEIGADGYSADAAEAVKLAWRLTGKNEPTGA
ncbi:MAG: dihydropteroate synthase [Lachnospiraceae bacterium]|nr:homocysteine S-methyltransferase family protein [uncultured Acetatifactor sp.]MCI8287567.1 dihydropteroate synthase [Lachnospiraceae bacterium]